MITKKQMLWLYFRRLKNLGYPKGDPLYRVLLRNLWMYNGFCIRFVGWPTRTQHQTDPFPTEFLLNIYEQQTTLAQADFTNYEKVWRHENYAPLLQIFTRTLMKKLNPVFVKWIWGRLDLLKVSFWLPAYRALIKYLWKNSTQCLLNRSGGILSTLK